MNEEPSLIWQIKKDFAEFKKGCLGIILFGSYARRDQTRRSDIAFKGDFRENKLQTRRKV